jgi:hypothetical protein
LNFAKSILVFFQETSVTPHPGRFPGAHQYRQYANDRRIGWPGLQNPPIPPIFRITLNAAKRPMFRGASQNYKPNPGLIFQTANYF